ncbi:YceI-like domain protein [compost metagenome]
MSAGAQAQVTVDVSLNPMGNFEAKTSSVSGTATMTGDEISAQNVVVNLKGLKTGVDLRDKHTQKHLETGKFPEAVLISAKGKGGKGTGKIKIRGIEKEISGTYKVEKNMLKADFDLMLNEFKIENINYMGVGVEDKVTLHVVIPIKK